MRKQGREEQECEEWEKKKWAVRSLTTEKAHPFDDCPRNRNELNSYNSSEQLHNKASDLGGVHVSAA